MAERSADQAYKENTAALQDAIKQLQAGLKRHAEEQSANPRDWSYSGDLSYVLDLIQQAARFICGEEE